MKFSDGESLLSNMKKNSRRFDVVYLDIKMNRINGIDTEGARLDRRTVTVIST